jgi:hypothetical protein
MPFRVFNHGGGKEQMYIDMFALHFGIKEPLERKTGSGPAPLRFGCSRAERDRILLLPVDDLVDEAGQHECRPDCQYYSPPTGVKSKYAFPCILLRYRLLDKLDMKSGLTLEEVGRIYGCTRERIRQIQYKAMMKLRHHSRRKRLEIFQEQLSEYQDEAVSSLVTDVS